jgi:hypothetical protein
MQKRLLLLVGVLIALGIGLYCWSAREVSSSGAPVALPSKSPSQVRGAGEHSELELRSSSVDAVVEIASEQPVVADSRITSAPAGPVGLEQRYRNSTWKELDVRAAQLWEAVITAGSDEAQRLRAEGRYERLNVEEVAERSKNKSREDGSRRYAGSFDLQDGSNHVGFVEFFYLDQPATAEIERERLFVYAKREQVREQEQHKP